MPFLRRRTNRVLFVSLPVVLLGLAAFASCATVYLDYRIQPVEKSAMAPGDGEEDPAKHSGGDIPQKILSFDRGRMLHSSERRNGLEMDYFVLRKEAMQRVVERLNHGERSDDASRYPDLFYLWLHLFNYGDSPVRFDSYCFRLRNEDTKRLLPSLTPEAYEKSYDGLSLRALPYYWSFEPKESRTFLHPIPDWYREEKREDTASDAEKRIRRTEELAWIRRRHTATDRILPGEELYAIVLFPLPEADYSYSLEYDAGGPCGGREGRSGGVPESQSGASIVGTTEREFSFPPLQFRITIERIGAWEDFTAERSSEDRDASRIWEREWQRIEADGRDLYDMHRQYRDHEALANKEKKETKDKKQVHQQ